MSVNVTCSDCFSVLRLPETAIGKRAKCRVCGSIVQVLADEPASLPPRRRKKKTRSRKAASSTAKTRQPPKPQQSGTFLWIALGGLALVVVAVAVFPFVRSGPNSGGGNGPTRIVNREQIKFTSDSDLAQSRTTSEWFDLLEEKRTTKNPMRKTMLKIRMPNPESFLGPDPAALPDILKALSNPHLSRYARAILKKFSQASEPPYLEDVLVGLKNDNPEVVNACTTLLALVRIEGPDTVRTMSGLLSDDSIATYDSACTALGHMKEPGFEVLHTELKKRAAAPHQSLIAAIGQHGEAAAAAVPELVAVLQLEDTQLRTPALSALSRIGAPASAALPVIEKMWLNESDSEWRAAIGDVFTSIGSDSVTVLRSGFTTAPAPAQLLAVGVFHELKTVDAVPLMIECLPTYSGQIYETTCLALSDLMPNAVVPVDQLAVVFEFGTPPIQRHFLEKLAVTPDAVSTYSDLLRKQRSVFAAAAEKARMEAGRLDPPGVVTSTFRNGELVSRTNSGEGTRAIEAEQCRQRAIQYDSMAERIKELLAGS